MIITCGQCQAKFKVAPEQIKESGSKVRCSNCQHVFTVHRPQPASPAADTVVPQDSLKNFLSDLAAAEPEKERRQRRRQLYSDLEDEPGKASADDATDFFADDDEDEAAAPHPPLRRAPRSAAPKDESAPPAEEDDDDELPPPLEEEEQRDSLGLGADPAHRPKAAAPPGARGASIRAAEAPAANRQKLFLGLAIVATALLAGIYFMANRPEPTALSVADQGTVAQPLDPNADGPEAGAANSDPGGTLGITFSKNNQNHYFRDNVKEGKILIITGMVRNSYPERRSFIHLRGRLLSADDSTLADRYAYAGNLLSEDELINLPISEIFSRLSIKGGQNGQNMNVEPGREVPFMMVFDKLPDIVAEYRIDPMGSTPAE